MSDNDSCAQCERYFNARSKPVWAFRLDGQPAGRLHRSCRRAHWLTDPAKNQVVAQFRMWEWDIARPSPVYRTDRWYAGMLIGWEDADVREVLTHDQEQLMQHWISGGTQLAPERAPSIRAAYAEMVRQFIAWRDATPALIA